MNAGKAGFPIHMRRYLVLHTAYTSALISSKHNESFSLNCFSLAFSPVKVDGMPRAIPRNPPKC